MVRQKEAIVQREDGLVCFDNLVFYGEYDKEFAVEFFLQFQCWTRTGCLWMEEAERIIDKTIFPMQSPCYEIDKSIWIHPVLVGLFFAKNAGTNNKQVQSWEVSLFSDVVAGYARLKIPNFAISTIFASLSAYSRYLADIGLYENEVVKRKKEKAEKTRVYFLHDKANRSIKIGFSSNVKERIEDLQIGNSSELVLIGTIKGGKSLEQTLHITFRKHRITGEWFNEQILPEVKALCKVNGGCDE
jgi:Meiotically up-regulated gene 113